MKFTLEDIVKAKETAVKYDLKGWQFFCQIPNQKLQEICNGIGNSAMPKEIRAALDALHPSLKVVAMIHDARYYYGTGSKTDFSNANREFAENGRIMAFALYGWYNPARYMAWYNATKFASICDVFGYKAYLTAIKEREQAC